MTTLEATYNPKINAFQIDPNIYHETKAIKVSIVILPKEETKPKKKWNLMKRAGILKWKIDPSIDTHSDKFKKEYGEYLNKKHA